MLRRLWLNYITSNLGDNIEYAYLSKILFVNTFSLVGTASLLAFSATYLISGEYLYAAIEFTFFLIGLGNLLALRKTGNADLASTIILFFMIGVLVFLYVTGGTQETGFLWYFTYPLLAFFLKEKKEGAIWLIALVAVTLNAALLQRIGIFPSPTYSIAQTVLLIVCLAAIALLTTFYANMRKKLEEVRVAREAEQIQRKLIEDQLDIARGFQEVLFPKEDIVSSGAEVAGAYRTAQKVGGDYFDFLMIDDSRIAVLLCDVSGHGVPAAMGMVNIRGIFRALLMGEITSPAAIFKKANNILIDEFRDEHFAAFSFCIFDQVTRKLQYCNAGQPHGVHYSAPNGGITEVESIAMPLGVMYNNNQYVDRAITLLPGDLFLMYTDGVTETANDAGEPYGKDRFYEVIMKCPGGSVQEINHAIMGDLEIYLSGKDVTDDTSIITLKAL